MKVFLAGASGAIGRGLLPQLVTAGHQVTAMTRSASTIPFLREAGAEGIVCDVFDRESLKRAIDRAEPEAVVHELTAGARLFLSQSIAFAYAPAPSPADESAPLYSDAPRSFRSIIEAVKEMETLVLARPGGIALRYGFFTGPGTAYAPGGSFHEDVLKRRIPIPGQGSGVFSFIHVRDAARATLRALEAGKTGVFNIVDDEPAPLRVWLPEYARLIGAPKPLKVPGFLTRLAAGAYGVYLLQEQPGAMNGAARRTLGWTPEFPSWRRGFEQV